MKHHSDQEEPLSFSELGEDCELDPADSRRKKEIRRKLEERMERRRLKQELEDYDGEYGDDFDWDEFDKD